MTDRLVLVVVVALASIAVLCLSAVTYLAAQQLGIPDVLVATTGASVGSLGSILAVQRTGPT